MKALRFTVAVVGPLLWAAGVSAEVSKIEASRQWGLGYLQLIVMEDQKLIERHARALGLGEVSVHWRTLGSASVMNDALIAGSVDLISIGPVGLSTLWAKTRNSLDVRGLSGLNAVPLYLLSRNRQVKSVDDLSDNDRIALPAVKVSTQAIMLEMAAARRYGIEQFSKFDHLTVTASHPNALAMFLNPQGEVTAYFSSPPFQYKALTHAGVHRILSAFDVLGGPVSFTNVVMTGRFCSSNPKTCLAIYGALDEATKWINGNKREAASTYLRVTKEKTPIADILHMLDDPEFMFTLRPMAVQQIADFLYRTGAIKRKPGSWKDLYFEHVYEEKGS